MLVSANTKIAGVVGDPISHSLSPKLHNYLLEKHQIDGIYIPFRIIKEDLKECLNSFIKLGFKGCNVTIPHKESALKICHSLSKTAAIVGAVNTIIITKDHQLYGHNSDGNGFINNIKQNYPDFSFINKKVVILGAGGAARAVCFALMQEKVGNITIANRNVHKATKLVGNFSKITEFKTKLEVVDWQEREKILKDNDLLVNTTCLGMSGQEMLEINLKNLPKTALVIDIVYQPLTTKLLINAQKQGNPIVTGIGMLINQALIGFEAWYQVKPEIDQKLIKQMGLIFNRHIS